MLKIKKVIILMLLIFITITGMSSKCSAAAIPVTDENLKETFQKFIQSEANEENYNISVANNVITITGNEESCVLTYDLTDKPTFIYEFTVQQGMSYAKFEEKENGIYYPIYGYVAVANIQGVEFEDAIAYGLLSFAGSILGSASGGITSESGYVIVDDLDLGEGVTIEKTDDPHTIYTSEFGERVMEYVNSMYKDKLYISDSTGINSYSLTVEKTETTDTSCKIVSTLTVNLDADFSKIQGFSDMLGEEFLNDNITEENADYVIRLKVGQKCNIETSEKITGHELYNGTCIELAEDYTEITAIDEGKANGYLYIGNQREKKSFYIIVEENTENEILDAITLRIDMADTENLPNPPAEENQETKEELKNDINEELKEEIKDNNTIKQDNTISSSGLPNTGLNNILFFIMIILGSVIIITALKLKEYKKID